ncbi:MAG: caspase family protein [Rhodospirillales bacterium]|nr:caspase family protein [Rhodospirillales bacterium]
MRLFTAIILSLAAMGGVAHAEKRVALVVGHSAYQNVPKLPNPVNDARAVAGLFKNAGFDIVDLRLDLSSIELKRAIREFAITTRDADIAVVFFAGHGFEINGINYLIPTDAKLATDFDAEDEAVRLDRLLAAAEPAKRLRLVILDACRDNPFSATMKRTIATRAISSGLAQFEPSTKDTLIAYAAKAGSVAEDGKGVNSPFTTALLQHITVPGLDVRIAFGRIRDEVMNRTANRQEPFVYGSLGGDIVSLVPAPRIPAVAVAAPPQATVVTAPPAATPGVDRSADVRRDYELAERIGTKAAWDSFLAVHQTGFYAELARAAVAKLEPAKPGAPVIAAIPPEAETPKAVATPDAAETTRELQVALTRVGCYAGAIDGEWGAQSRRALELYNQHANTKFDAKVASLDALEAAKNHQFRVCPLVCGRGFRTDGDRCVAVAAPQPEPSVRPSRRPTPPPAAASAPPPSGGNRAIACDKFGCKQVPAGCRVVASRGVDQQDSIVCN